MMGFNSPKNESIRRPRPFGLWLLATINVFVALFIAANSFWLLSILYDPVPQDIVFGPLAEIVSWIGVVLAIGLMLATTGVLAGRAPARTILFGILFIIGVAGAWDSWCQITGMHAMGYKLSEFTWRGWWSITLGLRLIAWVVLNYWYLHFSRARNFFTA
jgi:hypothetical protein